MGNVPFRGAAPGHLVSCEGCGASAERATTSFAPDGRVLCRSCFGHLSANQADTRRLHGYGGATFAPIGKLATASPRAFLWFIKLGLFVTFIVLVASVALAEAFGEWLHKLLAR